jgi:phospholipase C
VVSHQHAPVLSGIAREFGVFDHWFSEVPSQTFMNRSFWTAATSSGLVVNSPVRKWFTKNDAETIFERLEQHGMTWKVYVMEPMCLSFTGVIHYPRLKDRLATHFVRFSEFEKGMEHHLADRVGRARRNLRPRAPRTGSATRSGRTGG